MCRRRAALRQARGYVGDKRAATGGAPLITELADYLGHADPGFTLRTYTHLVPSSYQRARLAIDGVFGPTSTDGLEAA